MADYRAIMSLVLQGRSYRDVVAAVGCSHRDVAAARKVIDLCSEWGSFWPAREHRFYESQGQEGRREKGFHDDMGQEHLFRRHCRRLRF